MLFLRCYKELDLFELHRDNDFDKDASNNFIYLFWPSLLIYPTLNHGVLKVKSLIYESPVVFLERL